ncbi:MAG: (E)-4-hydroxy-3-methylbut-2-enyl-diphosphate synthase [bacterium]|nr:(E)-4-hydroxy-3-methylbut-2-enyl-diphosphate synthase [bacterium]
MPQPSKDALFRPVRRRTRVVHVGDVAIGGDHPIVVQSMTNTDTMDTAATVEQTIRLAEAGCEIVRVTAPSIRDAENLREIRKALSEARVDVPLVADIHFTPNAAMIAADIVEKVRVNPGNYADKKKFEVREYDDAEYEAEIARVHDRFRPLVQRCKRNGVALRIGTNHGSLSDRIMNRFGDTAEGMVESALEFLDVCEDERFHDVVFSMKASNTQVAIQAYRLLAARLEARAPGQPSYPFHVGVTEAGDAEDGRIKSAIGIGSLLEDGLGDTIRVSLTEDPVREVPVARGIADRAARVAKERSERSGEIDVRSGPTPDYFDHTKRETDAVSWAGLEVGGEAPVRVELEVPEAGTDPKGAAARLAMDLAALTDVACESLLLGAGPADDQELFRSELASLGVELPCAVRVDSANAIASLAGRGLCRVVATIDARTASDALRALTEASRSAGLALECEIEAADHALPDLVARLVEATGGDLAAISLVPSASLHEVRVLVASLADQERSQLPIVLRQAVEAPAVAGLAGAGVPEASLLDASVRLGGLLCDGIGDLVSLRSDGGAAATVDLAYRVLQGARQRTTRTEYISCPSCGRTLFDLEETTAKIKARTDHLSGVKIAVMGCIVNGPGEMADADFGYVGSGVGQVTLYVGKEVVARAVPEVEATDRLVDLIREHGAWVDPA